MPYAQVRSKLYELLANCVPPELIMRQLTFELLKRMDDEIKVRRWERCSGTGEWR